MPRLASGFEKYSHVIDSLKGAPRCGTEPLLTALDVPWLVPQATHALSSP